MKTIPLTKGKVTIVDDIDYEIFGSFKWSAKENRRKFTTNWYAVRSVHINGKKHCLRLHREILKRMGYSNFECDHRDGNSLNNRRCNLRTATRSQNNMNRPNINGISQYKGVYRNKNKWCAQIQINSKKIYLGRFDSEVVAAKTYDNKAKELFGEFGKLNFQ